MDKSSKLSEDQVRKVYDELDRLLSCPHKKYKVQQGLRSLPYFLEGNNYTNSSSVVVLRCPDCGHLRIHEWPLPDNSTDS